MAEEEDKDSKTEEPTEKKIKDAVEKGQTPVSREIPLLVSIAFFATYLIFSGEELIQNTTTFLSNLFERSGDIRISTTSDATNLFALVSTEFLFLMAPLWLLLMAGGILSSAFQNEPRLVLDRIAPKASKISLIKGWGRVFGKQGWVEFIKSVAKLSFAGGVVFIALYSSPEELLNGMFQDPIVVAKGQDLIALKIREIAKENDVPIFERIELARALNKVVQVDQIIPPDFYAAVAELINVIYKRTPQRAG